MPLREVEPRLRRPLRRGNRRYVESFSAYARQFLDRMNKPHADSISGILPAISIGQRRLVRTSRSTVATSTELQDYLRLLYAKIATLVCRDYGRADELVGLRSRGLKPEV